MSEPTMDEVVGRVRNRVAPDGRAWLPCDLDGNPIPEVSVDLANLLAAYQSVREAVRAETLREVRDEVEKLQNVAYLGDAVSRAQVRAALDALAHPEGTDLAVPVDILSNEWWEREVGEAK